MANTYCISDVHGRYSDLMRLLDAAGVSDDDHIFVLGDIVDRGPETRRCLRWAMSAPDNFTFLMGNHEDMLASYLATFACDGARADWFGVTEHPWTYNTSRTESLLLAETVAFGEHERLRRWYVGDVLPWLRRLAPFATARVDSRGKDRDFLMVHAGVEVSRPLWSDNIEHLHGASVGRIAVPHVGTQSKQKMLWLRDGYIDDAVDMPPCEVVSGHTPMTTRRSETLRTIAEVHGTPSSTRAGGICHIGRKHLIDCGSCYRSIHRECDLGMLRLDDLAEFYAKKKGPLYPEEGYLGWYEDPSE